MCVYVCVCACVCVCIYISLSVCVAIVQQIKDKSYWKKISNPRDCLYPYSFLLVTYMVHTYHNPQLHGSGSATGKLTKLTHGISMAATRPYPL